MSGNPEDRARLQPELRRASGLASGLYALAMTLHAARAAADPIDTATPPTAAADLQADGADELAPSASELEPRDLAPFLARYASEPSALQLARTALQAAERDPDRFDSLLRRARLRGLIPDLALGVRRVQGVDLRSAIADDFGARFTTGDDLVLSATLRFELGRLLFAGEEVAIQREVRVARAARLELVRSVIHWYFVRRRLQLERDLLGHTSLTRELRIAELEALLDLFTDGAFGRMIAIQPTHGQPAQAHTLSNGRRGRDRD
jgi:hypothetical protein